MRVREGRMREGKKERGRNGGSRARSERNILKKERSGRRNEMSRDEIFSKQTNVKVITKEKVRIERERERR